MLVLMSPASFRDLNRSMNKLFSAPVINTVSSKAIIEGLYTAPATTTETRCLHYVSLAKENNLASLK